MNMVEKIRRQAATGMAVLLVINLVLIAVRLAMREQGFDLAAAAGALLITGSALSSLAMDRTGAATRAITSMALGAQAAMLVYVFERSSLQIDMHMYFFALLAIAASWLDWRAIAAYSGLIAAHHLILYFVAPLAVFPGVSDFSRVLVHAVILVLQSAVLVLLCELLPRALDGAEQSTGRALEAETLSRQMVEKLQAGEQEAEERRHAFDRQRDLETAQVTAVVDGVKDALAEMARGNLAYRIATPFSGSFDQIRQSFNASADTLEAVLGQVQLASGVIREGTGAIGSATATLRDCTARQVNSAEVTAQSLDEVTRRVVETRQYAEEVGKTVRHACSVAQRSEAVVSNAVTAMQAISGSSQEISQIISVIDEIAFQTNLLALNAGVEAARAGDAGKGFAVVAQEVRELAQRCARAAQEIKVLISQSASLVENGVGLVDETGKALHEIAGEVNGISEVVEKIVGGTREQSVTLSGVSGAVNKIDRETRNNAVVVGNTLHGIATLAHEVEGLEEAMRRFTLSASPRSSHRRVA